MRMLARTDEASSARERQRAVLQLVRATTTAPVNHPLTAEELALLRRALANELLRRWARGSSRSDRIHCLERFLGAWRELPQGEQLHCCAEPCWLAAAVADALDPL